MLIICPYCNSTHVQLVVPDQAGSAALPLNSSTLHTTLSQMTSLAMLGMSIARKTSVLPPVVGGLASAVIAGLFGVSQREATMPQTSPYQFYCQDCQQYFSRPAIH